MKIYERTRFRGFTLVEVLVVIAIIGTLAGISFAAYNAIYAKGQEKATEARIQAITSELEATFLEFPEDLPGNFDGGVTSSLEVYKLLSGDNNGVPDGVIAGQSAGAAAGSGELPGTMADVLIDGNWVNENYYIVDAWGNPLRFFRNGGSGDNRPDFDLWSVGQDGISGTGDDLTNW